MIFDPTGKSNCRMTSSEVIYRYIHAGQGEVTLVSPGTLKAHTYRFEHPKNKREFPENTIFAYVLHDGHKMYLGMLDGSGFRRTAKSAFDEDTEAMRGVRYIVKMASRQDLVDRNLMHLYHSGKCCKCGKPLESYWGMKDGIGKRCLKKYLESLDKVPWDGN